MFKNVSEIPGALAAFISLQVKWATTAFSPALDAVASATLRRPALSDLGYDQFARWPLVGYAGEWRTFIVRLVRLLIAVFDPTKFLDFNERCSPDQHGFEVAWRTLYQIWIDWNLGAVCCLQLILLFCE